MTTKKPQAGTDKSGRLMAEALRSRKLREKTYREQALKMYPWLCAGCGREFSGKKLQELTVHHKDHNHDNNPPDGSNWELLCLYCHDNEHERFSVADAYGEIKPGDTREPPSTYSPFAALETLLKKKK
ncbi:MAG: HNH endonuclease [Deltaproteobacteria bacterium RIFOXYD12_FULL_57_12]|nr:MAG: HNH endonuclease [Deltaproteobacteria bacterium RIFOXYD12_FULL_57_12]